MFMVKGCHIMADITSAEIRDIADPRLRRIAVRVVREAELAIEKVAANHAEPPNFPLAAGDSKSIEQILVSRFRTLPQLTQRKAGMNAMHRINAPAQVRTKRFGDLAGIDLRKSVAVDAQVAALPFPATLKLPPGHLATLPHLHGSVLTVPGLAPQQTTDKLELRIHKVKCLDETNGFLGSEAGDDEIDLGGTSVDETGDTNKISPFRVGSDFDDGEQKVFSPPKRFTMFNLREGTAFPKAYFVTLVLAEVDMGGLPEFVQQLLNWVKPKVTAALAAALGGAIGASGGPVGAIIGAAVGAVVGLVFDLFKSIWEDDIFKPVTASVAIPSLSARWTGGKTDSPEGIATFAGHGGKYQLTYDWRVFA
jgi:hypothetical protein